MEIKITTDGNMWHLDVTGHPTSTHTSPEQAELALRAWIKERHTRPCGAAPNGMRSDAGIVRPCDCLDCSVGEWR